MQLKDVANDLDGVCEEEEDCDDESGYGGSRSAGVVTSTVRQTGSNATYTIDRVATIDRYHTSANHALCTPPCSTDYLIPC